MEEDIVAPMMPHFYKRYVDDTYIRRKKKGPDSVFEKLNSYHSNIKLTIEKNPTKFLDTKIIRWGCEIETKVYYKSKKLPVHRSSKIQTRYKRSAITGGLHRAKRIANDFNFKVKRITKKFLSTGFPRNFIRNTIEYFNKDERKYLFYDYRFQNQTKNLQKALSESSLYLQIINGISTLLGTLETLHHSFKLKIMLNAIAVLFMKVIVRVMKTMSVNP